MPHFFISYAKKDTRELALALDDALNKIDGVTAWADRSLRAGRSWELQIQAEIDRCDTMIVLYSPDLNRHKQGQEESYVLTEIAYAKYTVKKPIIPIMAQMTEPPMSLTTIHYIDFTLDGLTLDDLVQAICDETGLVIAAPYHVDDTIEDELYKEAVELVRRLNKASAPLLQRRLRIGYTRAAALIDMMEERGVVGPQLSESKPREVLPERSVSSNSLAVRAIIGDPFDWCEVPAGEFLYSSSKQNLTLPAFVIAKYPITYAQFQTFIDATDGFFDDRWWEGLAAEVADYVRKLGNQGWKIDTHPRENVSWYGAIAFCRWLSYKLRASYDLDQVEHWAVRLPTEVEWEKASRGTDGRDYPHGEKSDPTKCNTMESGIGKTTPVTQYPEGASPYGVLDMSGNLFEWCLTDYSNPASEAQKEDLASRHSRVLRGGAWANSLDQARTTYRVRGFPRDGNFMRGFRICTTEPIWL